MAWSIFKEGGGKQVAVGWAHQLLQAIGAPESAGNVQFVYDWELAEGGGGKYNPLNQGPVPGHPELTTTGSQYGGGAADFASWNAGIQGAADYLNMGNYKGILTDLRSNNPTGARNALIASPWAASHYGGGSQFPNSAIPGGTPVLPGTGTVSATGTTVPAGFSNPLDPKTWIDGFLGLIGVPDLKDLAERLGFILLGAALVFVGLHILGYTGKSKEVSQKVVQAVGGSTPEGRAAETAATVES